LSGSACGAEFWISSATDSTSMKRIEQYFSGSDIVRDVVIGMADGLTVPFALAASISGALTSTHIVVTGGLAEISAGSIAMGLALFGFVKGHYAGVPKMTGAWQTALVGSLGGRRGLSDRQIHRLIRKATPCKRNSISNSCRNIGEIVQRWLRSGNATIGL